MLIASLRSLVLALHLLCVNVATAGPLVCIWLEWRESRRGDKSAGRVGRQLGWSSLCLLLVGVLLGLTAGGLVWAAGEARYFETVGRLYARVWWAVWELLFSVACLAGYLVWWNYGRRASRWQQWSHRGLALLAATNLMYHFPPLFSVIAKVAAGSNVAAGPIDASALRALMWSGDVPARTMHFWIASAAVAGVMLMIVATRQLRRGLPPDDAGRMIVAGARLALGATLLQIPIGMWLLMQLPPADQHRLLGGDGWSLVLFGISILAAVALLHQLAAVSLGQFERHAVSRAVLLLVVVVATMVGVLHRSRDLELRKPGADSVHEGVSVTPNSNLRTPDRSGRQRGT